MKSLNQNRLVKTLWSRLDLLKSCYRDTSQGLGSSELQDWPVIFLFILIQWDLNTQHPKSQTIWTLKNPAVQILNNTPSHVTRLNTSLDHLHILFKNVLRYAVHDIIHTNFILQFTWTDGKTSAMELCSSLVWTVTDSSANGGNEGMAMAWPGPCGT